jgi:hypothetical protein
VFQLRAIKRAFRLMLDMIMIGMVGGSLSFAQTSPYAILGWCALAMPTFKVAYEPRPCPLQKPVAP